MNAKGVIFLSGKKVNLCPYDREKDLVNCQRWINNPEIRVYIENVFPITLQQEEEAIQRLSSDPKTVFLIIETKRGIPIGVMGLHKIDWISRTALTGAFIGEKELQGVGYGTDAKMTLLNYAFNALNLRKINSGAIAFNRRSVAYNLKCGYHIEGRKKRQVFRSGKYWDLILLAVFKKDFLKAWKEYQKQP